MPGCSTITVPFLQSSVESYQKTFKKKNYKKTNVPSTSSVRPGTLLVAKKPFPWSPASLPVDWFPKYPYPVAADVTAALRYWTVEL